MSTDVQSEDYAAAEVQSPKLRRESDNGETKPNLKMVRGVGSGPGRKSRACKSPNTSTQNREDVLTPAYRLGVQEAEDEM